MLSIQFTRKRISGMARLLVVQLVITSNRNADHMYIRLQSVHRTMWQALLTFFQRSFLRVASSLP